MSSDSSRLDAILETLMSYARHDFSPRVQISDRLDEIDAIATGINLLAEELDGETASRRELEAAYAHLQETQAQLVVAEKFAAIGQLANGVAHELNNPATWVVLGLEAMRRRLAHARTRVGAETGDLAEDLAAIEETLTDVHAGMERVRTVLGDLRTLSNVDATRSVDVDLDEVVRTSCHLARPAYVSIARLVLDLGGVPTILGDRGRLGQLVTNLVVNSAFAVADGGPDPEIAVSTRLDGDEIVLAVEDSGPGIREELFERVFDPYFTTKPSGVGMGLGLALVRKIAERHGGTARAMRGISRRGARVEVRLPVRGATAAPAASETASAPRAAPAITARGRILIIDDEPMLLRALELALGEAHDVVTARGGHAALDVLERDQAFDLVICDLQMPGIDGVAIYEALASRLPALLPRLVVMSGGAVTPRAAQFLENTRPRAIGKPIDVDEVLALARDFTAGARPT